MVIDCALVKKRLSKTQLIGRIIARLPFARCVILNGSLAQGKSKESSDIDILIIAKTGKIFTARFFVNVLAAISRIKRSKDDKRSHAGKFCFNYFLTEGFLTIPANRGEKIDRYCAENYSASKFVAGDRGLFEKFLLTNKPLFDKYSCYPEYVSSRAKCNVVERSYEKLTAKDSSASVGMTHLFGYWLEKILKNYQTKKIESDPRTKQYPELIIYNDQELRFHPPKAKK